MLIQWRYIFICCIKLYDNFFYMFKYYVIKFGRKRIKQLTDYSPRKFSSNSSFLVQKTNLYCRIPSTHEKKEYSSDISVPSLFHVLVYSENFAPAFIHISIFKYFIKCTISTNTSVSLHSTMHFYNQLSLLKEYGEEFSYMLLHFFHISKVSSKGKFARFW